MKKIAFFILIAITMSGCGIIKRTCHKSIIKTKKEIVSFSDLPFEVKEFLITVKNIQAPYDSTRAVMFDFFSNSENVPLAERERLDEYHCYPDIFIFNTDYEYKLTDVCRLTGKIPATLWISHFLLIDKTNNITYRINYEDRAFPLIIYNGELFKPTELMMYSTLRSALQPDAFETLIFEKYSLRNHNRRARKVHDR